MSSWNEQNSYKFYFLVVLLNLFNPFFSLNLKSVSQWQISVFKTNKNISEMQSEVFQYPYIKKKLCFENAWMKYFTVFFKFPYPFPSKQFAVFYISIYLIYNFCPLKSAFFIEFSIWWKKKVPGSTYYEDCIKIFKNLLYEGCYINTL